MRARDVMSWPVVTTRREAEIAEAARVLCDRGFTALPVVVDDDELVGIVTEADLMARRFPPDPRYRSGPDGVMLTHADGPVGDVMTTDVVTAHTGTDITTIAELMLRRRVRSVPVVHNGVATIAGEPADLTDRHVATVIAESVPGVTRAVVG